MKTTKFYAPPKVDMIALNTEQGFAQSTDPWNRDGSIKYDITNDLGPF